MATIYRDNPNLLSALRVPRSTQEALGIGTTGVLYARLIQGSDELARESDYLRASGQDRLVANGSSLLSPVTEPDRGKAHCHAGLAGLVVRARIRTVLRPYHIRDNVLRVRLQACSCPDLQRAVGARRVHEEEGTLGVPLQILHLLSCGVQRQHGTTVRTKCEPDGRYLGKSIGAGSSQDHDLATLQRVTV